MATVYDDGGVVDKAPPTSITMRAACDCGETTGTIVEKSGQACVYCSNCSQWRYNAPRSETGTERRSVASRPGVKSGTRARVLAAHGHQCIGCGRSPSAHGVVLHLDHIIPVEAAKRAGIYDELIESEWNLAPLCEECNLGKSDDIGAVSVQLMYRVLILKATPTEGGK